MGRVTPLAHVDYDWMVHCHLPSPDFHRLDWQPYGLRTNGAEGIQVWLEFKTQGKLKEFSRVELKMTAGGKHLVSAPLQVSRPTADSVSVTFSADPSYLATSEFYIVVEDPLGRIAYMIKVKDFVEPELNIEIPPAKGNVEPAAPAKKPGPNEQTPIRR